MKVAVVCSGVSEPVWIEQHSMKEDVGDLEVSDEAMGLIRTSAYISLRASALFLFARWYLHRCTLLAMTGFSRFLLY
jgi:hypothetical protein